MEKVNRPQSSVAGRDTKDNFLALHSAKEAGGKGVVIWNGELVWIGLGHRECGP